MKFIVNFKEFQKILFEREIRYSTQNSLSIQGSKIRQLKTRETSDSRND